MSKHRSTTLTSPLVSLWRNEGPARCSFPDRVVIESR